MRRFWRRFRGGHWERWNIDVPVASLVWLPVRDCIHDGPDTLERRPALGRGTPQCEDWPAGGRLARVLHLARSSTSPRRNAPAPGWL